MRFYLMFLCVLLAGCSQQSSGPVASSADASRAVPELLEATYGANCADFAVPTPGANTVTAGNGTAAVRAACADVAGSCDFMVDVGALGDPAVTCPKDFDVKWRCGNKVRSAHVAAEAHGSKVGIACD